MNKKLPNKAWIGGLKVAVAALLSASVVGLSACGIFDSAARPSAANNPSQAVQVKKQQMETNKAANDKKSELSDKKDLYNEQSKADQTVQADSSSSSVAKLGTANSSVTQVPTMTKPAIQSKNTESAVLSQPKTDEKSPYEEERPLWPWPGNDNHQGEKDPSDTNGSSSSETPLKPGSEGESGSSAKPSEKVNTPFLLLADYSKSNILLAPKQSSVSRSLSASFENLASVQEIAYQVFKTEAEKENLYFLELEQAYVIVDLNNQLTGEEANEKINFASNLYVSGEQNLLKEATPEQLRKTDNKLYLVAGDYRNEEHLLAAEHILGLPGNRFNACVALFEQGKSISGLQFDPYQLPNITGGNHSFISISSQGTGLEAVIDHNRFAFSAEDRKTAVYRAIGARTVTGHLLIEKNTFTGDNSKKDGFGTPTAHAMVQTMTVLRENQLHLTVRENVFRQIATAAIEVYAGEYEDVRLLHNFIDQVGEEGIKVDLPALDYPKQHHLQVEGNVVQNYGLNPHENYSDGGAGALAPSGDGENGIAILYYNGVQYGSLVNQKWHSSIEQLTQTVSLANTVMGKAENDQNKDVVSSIPVRIGPNSYYVNTSEKINKAQQYGLSRHSLVIVKNENGDVTYGHDAEQPTSFIEVDNLYLTGSGSGIVTLPSTLKIKGNLVVELPNGQVKVEATVLGTKTIQAGLLKNAASFRLIEPQPIPRGGFTADTFDIQIENVLNDQGAAVAHPNFAVSVLMNNKLMAAEDYRLDGSAIKIKREVINQLTRNAHLLIRVQDRGNQISEITSPILQIQLSNLSGGSFTYSAQKIFHLDADPITVQISNLRNNKGEVIPPEQSVLKGHVSFTTEAGRPIDDELIRVDDATDTVTLPSALLNRLAATEYGSDRNTNVAFQMRHRVVVNDPSNQIFDAVDEVTLRVVDNSSAEFVFEQGKTFTEGHAPASGLTLHIRNVHNTKGQLISAAQTKLKRDETYSNIHIEPFPASREEDETKSELIVLRDAHGEFIREIFNPRFYHVDDDADTITFTQEYLNSIKPQKEASTEHGIKVFTFAIVDEVGKLDVRGFKTPIHIKLLDKPLSTTTTISFKENTYRIDENKVVNVSSSADKDLMVAGLLKNIIKHNPRQQVLVKRGSTLLRAFDLVAAGDILQVIAEDGKTTVSYTIDITIPQTELSSWVTGFDQTVIAELSPTTLMVHKAGEQNYSIRQVVQAIHLASGVTAKVVKNNQDGVEYEPVQDSTMTDEMTLVLIKDGVEQRVQIRIQDGVHYRALLVGNSNYNSEKLDLKGPVNDLKLMQAVFQRNKFDGKRFTRVEVKENVLKQDFLQAIRTTFAQATDEDVSYIYYSGHGFNAADVSYLCTVDPFTSEDMAQNVKNWISVDELKLALDQVKGRKVLILDSCNAGGFIGKNFVDAISGPTRVPGRPGNGGSIEPNPPGDDGSLDDLDSVADAAVLRVAVAEEASEEASVEQPTVMVISPETVLSSAEREAMATTFTANVRAVFERNKDLQYLTDPEYKVLVASSANEFSYEDKQKALGKFTEKLAKGVGFENGQMFADKNSDRAVTLDELYTYLMDEVESTSHIQVFPHLDPTPVFADMDAVKLSDEVRVEAKEHAYTLSFRQRTVQGKKQWIGNIRSDLVKIANISVGDFLSHLVRKHPSQVLEVVRTEQGVDTVLTQEEKLIKQSGRLYFLKVTAEDGTMQKFSIVVEKELKKITPETETRILSSDPNIEVIARDPVYAVKLKKSMSTEEFIQSIQTSNSAKKQTYKLYSQRKAEQKEVAATVQVANLDVLEVIAPDGVSKQDYNITVLASGSGLLPIPGIGVDEPGIQPGPGTGNGSMTIPEPDFGGAFVVVGTEIRSGTVQLTTAMTVEQFIGYLRNKDAVFRIADPIRSGFYPTHGTVSPWTRPKAKTEKLGAQDTLRIFTVDNKVKIYQLVLASS